MFGGHAETRQAYVDVISDRLTLTRINRLALTRINRLALTRLKGLDTLLLPVSCIRLT